MPDPDVRPAAQRPLVIQTEHLDAQAAAWLGERCRLEVCTDGDPRFAGLLEGAEALVIRTYTLVDAALLARAPRLRVVGRAGVGLDNIDLAACAERGVAVVSTPGANTRAVVEYVTALMLDALRPRVFLEKPLAPADWKKLRTELIAPRELSELTLGVLGLGRVGTGVARVGAALDMRVLYHDLAQIPADRLAAAGSPEPSPFDDLLRRSDVLSVHVDGRAGNRNLIGAPALALCKPTAVIINTSRGFVIEPFALADYLLHNRGAQALLDVHEPEPFTAAHPLLDLPNAHLSAHIAAATARAHANMSWVVRDVWRVLCGETPEFPAVPEPR